MDQADKKEQTDDLVSGSALLVGSLPTMGVASRLFQATQGYITNPGQTAAGSPPPNLFDPTQLFNLIKQAIDQEIQLFLQGLLTAAQLEARLLQLTFADIRTVQNMINQALAALPQAIFSTTDQVRIFVDGEINAIVPNVLAAAGVAYQYDVAAVKTTLDKLVSAWNSFQVKIPGFSIPNPLGGNLFSWGGYTINLPKI